MAELEKIARDHVVAIAYTLKDDEGNVLDESEASEPLFYLHGHDQILPALEAALEDRSVGYSTNLSVAAEEGYGPYEPERVLTLPKERFPFPVEVGQVLHAEMENGQKVPFQVISLGEKDVTLDGNHPLAGKNLHFSVTVVEVRPSTDEERHHGHAHGPHGHGH
jgi:FKBP-type peptidyl-prolyl cis-trans isomerase SlyD